MQFREALASASGIQSSQYRAVEFILGHKDSAVLKVFESEPPGRAGDADRIAG